MSTWDLSGGVAVVTGAGSGIGRALTLALAGEGAHVAASDIDPTGLTETQQAAHPGRVSTYPLDVADRDAVLMLGIEPNLRWNTFTGLVTNLAQDLFASGPLPQTARLMLKDEDVCVHCGLCAERCPTSAWDMQKYVLHEPYAGRPAAPPVTMSRSRSAAR